MNDSQIQEILKKNRKKRIRMLKKIIENGEYSNQFIQSSLTPRQEYKSPQERSSYNYGYMTQGEAEDLASPKIDPDM